MCPGGYVVPSQSQPFTIRVNGMSNSPRNSPFSNSAVVITIDRNDIIKFLNKSVDTFCPTDGFKFRQLIEQAAYKAGDKNYFAPAQRVTDFLKGKVSTTLPDSSFRPGIFSHDLNNLFPPFLTDYFKLALRNFDKKMKGFVSEHALLIAPETATSSPVTVLRDNSGQSVSVKGFYPIGEGAGYAGGITSSAMDGVKIVTNILKNHE